MPIEDGSDNEYILNYIPQSDSEIGVGKVKLVHNMKWSSHRVENSHKKAYLSSLLLHVYAQLFEEDHFPVTLKWSYPSSMSQSLIGDYSEIWATLNKVNPLINGQFDLKIYPANQGYADTSSFNWNKSTETSSPWQNITQSAPTWQTEPLKSQPNGLGDSNKPKADSKEISINSAPVKFDS